MVTLALCEAGYARSAGTAAPAQLPSRQPRSAQVRAAPSRLPDSAQLPLAPQDGGEPSSPAAGMKRTSREVEGVAGSNAKRAARNCSSVYRRH